MKLTFKRITSSGSFIPEIDGLRFIAILSVILFHLSEYLNLKDTHKYSQNFDFAWLRQILSHGHLGVPLFFIISGFILAMPFAKFYLNEGKPIKLKDYFFRRLTRLEPPYILAMTFLLIAYVLVLKRFTLSEGLSSYFSSIFYVHNFIYGKDVLPLLNVVAWSLEIEVQFYILTPLITRVFAIKSPTIRRVTLLLAIVFFIIFNHFVDLPFKSLIGYIQYFLIGFLLADLYICKSTLFKKTKFDSFLGLIFFTIIWVFDTKELSGEYKKLLWELFQIACIFLFYYYVLFHGIFNILRKRVVTNIGGMCYSIYLIHFPVIGLFGNLLIRYSFSSNELINVSIYTFTLLSVILFASAIFFLLIERPCMDKDWHKKLLKRFGFSRA